MANFRSSGDPVTPKLTEAPAKPVNGEASPPELGAAAPSNPPSTAMSPSEVDRIIKERVDEAVRDKLKALELDDPTKEAMTQEDQQFAHFDKRLEIFGVDLAEAIPGFTCHWFNDEGDRIPRMSLMGWAFVKRTEVGLNEKLSPLNQDLGENIALYVGTNAQGGALRAFLMKIPTEIYERRYARAQEHNDMIEDMIKRGGIGDALSQGGYAGTDGPSGVKINYNPHQAKLVRGPKPS